MGQIVVAIAVLFAVSAPSLPKLSLGEKIPAKALRKANHVVLVSPAQFQPMWLWTYDGIEYMLGADEAGYVQFISTQSKLVSTPEGVQIGQRFADLAQVTGVRFTEWPGWGKIAELPSGWNAACYSGLKLPDASSLSSDEVDAIFKGTAAGYGQRKSFLRRWMTWLAKSLPGK